jgi:hypothetical protein
MNQLPLIRESFQHEDAEKTISKETEGELRRVLKGSCILIFLLTYIFGLKICDPQNQIHTSRILGPLLATTIAFEKHQCSTL